jgi:hypothetical protein
MPLHPPGRDDAGTLWEDREAIDREDADLVRRSTRFMAGELVPALARALAPGAGGHRAGSVAAPAPGAGGYRAGSVAAPASSSPKP